MIKLKIIIFVVIFLFSASLAFADVGEQFSASIFLNTEQEPINAVEGKIIFPAEFLELKEIRDGNSIINFWVERPKNTGNEIIFSGIIPGGYQDTNGFLFSAIFEIKTEGDLAMKIQEVKAFLNDGKGTLAENAQIFVSKNVIPKVEDTDQSEDFKPEIAQNIGMFNSKWFLVFATQDKNSGIDHYEICEDDNKKCVSGESPYVLQNQKLDKKIFIKAIDKDGNERVVVLQPKNFLALYKSYLIWSIMILVIILSYAFYRKRKKTK